MNSRKNPMRPCIKCGVVDRDARGNCAACARAIVLKWRAKNPDKVKAHAASWRATSDKEKAKASHAAWYVANSGKAKANAAAYKAANPEKVKKYEATWKLKNKAHIKAYGAAYNAKNFGKKKEYTSAWSAANPEARRIMRQNRRARQHANGGVLSAGLSAKLIKLQRGQCACCRLPLGENYHLDHIMPLSLGGSNTDDNIQLLRQRCNNQKHAKHPVDFMQERGYLL